MAVDINLEGIDEAGAPLPFRAGVVVVGRVAEAVGFALLDGEQQICADLVLVAIEVGDKAPLAVAAQRGLTGKAGILTVEAVGFEAGEGAVELGFKGELGLEQVGGLLTIERQLALLLLGEDAGHLLGVGEPFLQQLGDGGRFGAGVGTDLLPCLLLQGGTAGADSQLLGLLTGVLVEQDQDDQGCRHGDPGHDQYSGLD